MRSISTCGGVVAVVLFGMIGCGPDGTNAPGVRSEGVAEHSLAPDDDDDEGDEETNPECDEINGRLQKAAFKMQMTKEFQALAKTPEFKKVVQDMKKMRQKKCSVQGGVNDSAECIKLRMAAMRHQQALMDTEEFDALSKTPEFKKMMKVAREAMQKGCLEGMGFGMDADSFLLAA